MPEGTSNRPDPIRIGVAGWSIPKEHADRFPAGGPHLSRYASRLPAVEINTSFYRPHRPATYARWAATVPDDFRFSVKVPKLATHERRLVGAEDVLDAFLAEVAHLGEKLGPLLVQLPPSLKFDADAAESFFFALRQRHEGSVAVEPRHATWFGPEAELLLTKYRMARVAADPAIGSAEPGGWGGLVYYRLHGSPRIYYSDYPAEFLESVAKKLAAASQFAQVWCIFDNTAAFAATANALNVRDLVR